MLIWLYLYLAIAVVLGTFYRGEGKEFRIMYGILFPMAWPFVHFAVFTKLLGVLLGTAVAVLAVGTTATWMIGLAYLGVVDMGIVHEVDIAAKLPGYEFFTTFYGVAVVIWIAGFLFFRR